MQKILDTQVQISPDIKYRPDIDGLRAIAVLGVIIFHALPSWIPGGFIGVDIFFVISGFLISTIIFTHIEQQNFSFTEFYARRINRIFPALIIVVACCYLFGWVLLLPDEYKQLSLHIVSGLGFISNLVLWHESGYFDKETALKPLMHLWSLGVEEQFYIIWPSLIWLCWKLRISLFFTISAIIAGSFAYNIYEIGHDEVADFYSPLSRFWELLAGAALSYIQIHRRPDFAHKLCNGASWLGFILILTAFHCFREKMNFPGGWALMPVMGSVLIIASGPEAWVNRTLL